MTINEKYETEKEQLKAFETFFIQYYPRIKGFINNLLQDVKEAEDISQDIFLYLWNNKTTLQHLDNREGYLFRIAKNAVYRHVERLVLFEKYQLNVSSENTRSQYYEIEEEINAQELEVLLSIAIEKMPPQRKRIFQMSRKKGLNNEEIANELHISKRTVENHLTQALKDIRKIISLLILIIH